MIKVSILYPNSPDARFDVDYYATRHMPMVKNLLGACCTGFQVDIAMPDHAADAPAPYIAMGHLLCDSLTAFQTAFAPHAETIMADIANYTNLTPQLQFSTVLV
ncbi:EthD family reductase [Massilia sp. TS11]|uniref:EthD family reductase n=1 Tax=Massilia sp. TS11 TaxID=2908003 RepID=UPI001EDB56B9|nr:EthD family reductase [Massilia sp. TS11]MCG2585614.1 EthD family reductase [Massilia sp. TS11]